MPDEPSNAELARQIAALRQDQREDFADVKSQIGQMVRQDLYNAQRTADAAEIKGLKDKVAALESRGRWYVAAIIVPFALVILNWLLTVKAVKQ